MWRHALLAISLALLVGALCLLRSHRFVPQPGSQTVDFASIQQNVPVLPQGAAWIEGRGENGIRLEAGSHGQVMVNFDLPLIGSCEALCIDLQMKASALKPGSNRWEDGRVLIEWLDAPGGRRLDTDPVMSARDDDEPERITVVVKPPVGTAVPVLRLENLGSSGVMDVTHLELRPVRERTTWFRVPGLLWLAWFGWWVVFLRSPDFRAWRVGSAVLLWMWLAATFAFPGPWQALRPFVLPYQIEQAVDPVEQVVRPLAPLEPPGSADVRPEAAAVDPIGRLPIQGGWIMRVKHHLAKIRLVLHALLVFVPALVWIWWVGRRNAIYLAGSLAVSIEAAQVGFGFGFDWLDGFDLLFNAAGIAAALWLHGRIRERFHFSRAR